MSDQTPPPGGAYYDPRTAHPDISDTSEPKKSRRRLFVWLGIIAGLAVLVAAVGAFGGLRAQRNDPQSAKPGSTVHQGLFDVQVLDARAGRIKASSFEDAKNTLIVRLRVTDLGQQSYGVLTFLEGLVAEPKPGRYVEADATESEGDVKGYKTSTIHPRLPVVVQVVWPLPEGTTPKSVTLVLRKWSYDQSFTTETFNWSAGKSAPIQAKVTVPVRPGATS